MLAGVPGHHSGGRQPVPARPWVVQRLAREVAPTVEESAVPEPGAAAEGESALLAEDDVADLASGQMRKRAFLAELRTGVCATAEESLAAVGRTADGCPYIEQRSEEHTSELQSRVDLVCRLLLEKKNMQ